MEALECAPSFSFSSTLSERCIAPRHSERPRRCPARFCRHAAHCLRRAASGAGDGPGMFGNERKGSAKEREGEKRCRALLFFALPFLRRLEPFLSFPPRLLPRGCCHDVRQPLKTKISLREAAGSGSGSEAKREVACDSCAETKKNKKTRKKLS